MERDRGRADLTAPAGRAAGEGGARRGARRGAGLRALAPTFASYFLFGLGYVSYMTFAVALLRDERESGRTIALFRAILGSGSLLTPAWGRALGSRPLRGGRGFAATLAVLTLASSLPLASAGPAALYLSAFLFGSALMAVTTAAAALVRGRTAAAHWTSAFGALTVSFGVGQTIGPLATGLLSDTPARLHLGLLASTLVLAPSAPIALAQRTRPDGRRRCVR